jgi:long-chain acyl-CoA synthetase
MEAGAADLPRHAGWRDSGSTDDPGVEVDPAAPALQLYTSGTTGKPKGVMLSHRNILSGRRDAMRESMPWNEWLEGDVNLVALPVGHIGGVGWAIVSFFNGARTLVHRDFVPSRVLEAIEQQGVSKLFLVPAALHMLLLQPRVREIDYGRLRFILYGASPIALDLLREATEVFGCGFCQQYGMTETCGTIVYLPPEDHDPAGNERMRGAGLPMPGVEIRVVDPQTRAPLPARRVGEVETRSVANMVGYWNRAAETSETIDAAGWLRTGDAGYLDEDGYLYIHDRFKDMICTGAENVYPAEVESAIFGHPDVLEVAVIGVPDPKWGEAVKAVVVPRPGTSPDPRDILDFARTRLAGFKVPKSVEIVPALPRGPTGKLLRRVLREPYWAGHERRVN